MSIVPDIAARRGCGSRTAALFWHRWRAAVDDDDDAHDAFAIALW